MDKILEIDLNHSNGAEKKLRIRIPAGFYSVDIVVEPLFQICDATLELELASTPVSCKAGCSACCNQLIPLSGAEAIYLAKSVAALPREKRRRLTAALARLREKSQRLIATSNAGESGFHQRYFHQGTACPFLENGRCGIYGQRPLACREYHVDTSPHYCRNPYNEPVNRVAKGLNLGALLTVFSARMLRTGKYPIPVFLLDIWGRDNPYVNASFDTGLLLENLLQGIKSVVEKSTHFAGFEWRYVQESYPINYAINSPIKNNNNHNNKNNNNNNNDEGKRFKPSRVIEPLELPKLLVRHAGARNIKKIVSLLLNLNGNPGEREESESKRSEAERVEADRFVEIGSGDGYFRYLAEMSGDSKTAGFSRRIIETEADKPLIDQCRARGKLLLHVDAKYLTEAFGEAFTPLVLSTNVLDVFSDGELGDVLREIFRVLKPGGCVAHIMSSSIHPSVFKNIAAENAGKVLLPYVEAGFLGVAIVGRSDWVEKQFPHFSRDATLLARQFQQSPEEYVSIAKKLLPALRNRNLTYKTQLLHDYSLARLVNQFIECGFNLIAQRLLTSSSTQRADTYHRQLGDINKVVNHLGVMEVDKLSSIPQGKVTETSTFAILVGRKPPP